MRTPHVTLALCAVVWSLNAQAGEVAAHRSAAGHSFRGAAVVSRVAAAWGAPALVRQEVPIGDDRGPGACWYEEGAKFTGAIDAGRPSLALFEQPPDLRFEILRVRGAGDEPAAMLAGLGREPPGNMLIGVAWEGGTVNADRCDAPLPGGAEFTAREDLCGFLPGVWRDARGVVRARNVLILSAALAAAIGIRQDLDDEVRQEVARHPLRWGDGSRFLGYLGEAPYQVPVLGLIWGTSIWTQDAELNSLSKALISAYTINGLAVLVIKGIADTERPDPDWNGGRWGFPSFHAASAFAIAGVLDEYAGCRVALPCYTLAGLIAWSRIDQRDHDLSDVVFGAALGWVIGKSVASQHLRGDGRVRIVPWRHPEEGGAGLLLDVRY